MDDLTDGVGSVGDLSRRDALKRGALVIGAATLWTTPIVQTLGMRPAAAGTADIVPNDFFSHIALRLTSATETGVIGAKLEFDGGDPTWADNGLSPGCAFVNVETISVNGGEPASDPFITWEFTNPNTIVFTVNTAHPEYGSFRFVEGANKKGTDCDFGVAISGGGTILTVSG